MPPRADAPTRDDLLRVAARMLADEGPAGLTLRRLAQAAGTSTMAIYTRFGGMPQLRKALRGHGFDALAARMANAPADADPVDHAIDLCLAYVTFGAAEPDLYRVMFTEQPFDAEDAARSDATFEPLVRAVAACGFDGDPRALATELWIAGHGVVTLAHAQLLGAEQAAGAARATLAHLLEAFGADDAAARVSRRP